jgi:hypothetical protein
MKTEWSVFLPPSHRQDKHANSPTAPKLLETWILMSILAFSNITCARASSMSEFPHAQDEKAMHTKNLLVKKLTFDKS